MENLELELKSKLKSELKLSNMYAYGKLILLHNKVWGHSESGSLLTGCGTVTSLVTGAWVLHKLDLISWAAQGLHWVLQA